MKFYLISLFILFAAAVSAQIPYKVIVPVHDLADGTWAFMTDYDSGATVDSARVTDHKALFTGDVDEPFMVKVSAAGKVYGTLVLEQGTSTINQASGLGVGTMLNDCLKTTADSLAALHVEASGADREALVSRYIEIARNAIDDNSDTPVAYYFFLDLSRYAPPHTLRDILASQPSLSGYAKVKALGL